MGDMQCLVCTDMISRRHRLFTSCDHFAWHPHCFRGYVGSVSPSSSRAHRRWQCMICSSEITHFIYGDTVFRVTDSNRNTNVLLDAIEQMEGTLRERDADRDLQRRDARQRNRRFHQLQDEVQQLREEKVKSHLNIEI